MSFTPRTDAAWQQAKGHGVVAEVRALDSLARELEQENAELRMALRSLLTRCEEHRWPKVAEDMTPLTMARALLDPSPKLRSSE